MERQEYLETADEVKEFFALLIDKGADDVTVARDGDGYMVRWAE